MPNSRLAFGDEVTQGDIEFQEMWNAILQKLSLADFEDEEEVAEGGNEESQPQCIVSTLKLLTKDNKIVEIDLECAEMSKVLKDMIFASEANESVCKKFEEPILFEEISSEALYKFIEWAKHHKEEPEETDEEIIENYGEGEESIDSISKWDREFLKDVHFNLLCQLITLANVLDVHDFTTLCGKTFAKMMTGAIPE